MPYPATDLFPRDIGLYPGFQDNPTTPPADPPVQVGRKKRYYLVFRGDKIIKVVK